MCVFAAGDVRRALELLRRAVEIGRAEHLRSTVVARTAAAAAAKQPLPNDHDVVVEWQQGSAALVKRPHMTQAQQEMFGALHLQLLRSRSLWEKVLLVAVVVEARATGSSAVVIQVSEARDQVRWCMYSPAASRQPSLPLYFCQLARAPYRIVAPSYLARNGGIGLSTCTCCSEPDACRGGPFCPRNSCMPANVLFVHAECC